VKKYRYGNHLRRMNYQLTARGQSLRPVLQEIIDWGLENIPEVSVPETDCESQL